MLIAHGDATSGYACTSRTASSCTTCNIGGTHQIVRSTGRCRGTLGELGFRMTRGDGTGTGVLLIDGEPAAERSTADFWS